MARLEARHPLLGRLRRRWKSSSSGPRWPREVLEAATALAQWRIERLREVEALHAELHAEPWPDAAKVPSVEPVLACGDLLRALLAVRLDDLAPMLAGGPAHEVRDMIE